MTKHDDREAAREKALADWKHQEAYNAFCNQRQGLADWESHKDGYESGFDDGYDAAKAESEGLRQRLELLLEITVKSNLKVGKALLYCTRATLGNMLASFEGRQLEPKKWYAAPDGKVGESLGPFETIFEAYEALETEAK